MTIEERVTQLERRNRRLTLALVLVGLATSLAVAVGMAAPDAVPEEVKAHRFVVVDADGKTRAELGGTKERSGLTLYDDTGMKRAILSGAPGLLALCGENGKSRAFLIISENRPYFSISDTSGRQVVKAGPAETGGGFVNISNTLGKEVVSIQADKTNCGLVAVFDQNGELKSGLTVK